MQASEQDGSVTRRRSTRRHAPNINRQEVLTLGEAMQLRAQLASGKSGSIKLSLELIGGQMNPVAYPLPQIWMKLSTISPPQTPNTLCRGLGTR
jgi:hypothetical protein